MHKSMPLAAAAGLGLVLSAYAAGENNIGPEFFSRFSQWADDQISGTANDASSPEKLPNTGTDLETCDALKAGGFITALVQEGDSVPSIAKEQEVSADDLESFSVRSHAIADAASIKSGMCLTVPKSTVNPLTTEEFATMQGISWRKGCLSGKGALRRVRVPYLGFDGTAHMGDIDVNRKVAADVGDIFEELYSADFPIKGIRPLEKVVSPKLTTQSLGGPAKVIDDASIAQDNTSAFNCRHTVSVTSPDTISKHGLGQAIDINPLENPYKYDGEIYPPSSKKFFDRDQEAKGLITPDGEVVAIFTKHGWRWGGTFKEEDYQHFDTGRS